MSRNKRQKCIIYQYQETKKYIHHQGMLHKLRLINDSRFRLDSLRVWFSQCPLNMHGKSIFLLFCYYLFNVLTRLNQERNRENKPFPPFFRSQRLQWKPICVEKKLFLWTTRTQTFTLNQDIFCAQRRMLINNKKSRTPH